MKHVIVLTLAALTACTTSESTENTAPKATIENPTNAVILSSEIEWEKLNPARGDASPQAGTIWGDRKAEVATGFLAKFVDGFSSPPHIHNITYRAVVIEGSIHNDDPNAEMMWMKPGSFWTQPVGEPHITAAKGETNIAYVEIDHGPYLVQPTEEAFDNGERPINMDASNVVWQDSQVSEWIAAESGAQISFLWEDENNRGLFLKLPNSFEGEITSEGTEFHAVVIRGDLEYTMPGEEESKTLDPGSYFTSTDKAIHEISATNGEVIVYVRTNSTFQVE